MVRKEIVSRKYGIYRPKEEQRYYYYGVDKLKFTGFILLGIM